MMRLLKRRRAQAVDVARGGGVWIECHFALPLSNRQRNSLAALRNGNDCERQDIVGK
jgi:hypothetical protein